MAIDVSDLTMLMVIIEKDHDLTAVEALESVGIDAMTFVGATGTGVWQHVAREVSPHKTLVMSVIPRNQLDRAMAALADKAGLSEPGRGVAFAIPVEAGMGAGISQDMRTR